MGQVSTLPVTLSNVKSVFGSTTLYNLRRGGGYVPGIANAYSAISTTTPNLSTFAGAIYPPVQLPAGIDVYDFSIATQSASAFVYVGSLGYVTEYAGGVLQANNQWKLAGHQADYDVQFIRTDNDGGSGEAVNTWLTLQATRSWSCSTSGSGYQFKSQSGYLLLRMNASPQTVFANVSISIRAETEV